MHVISVRLRSGTRERHIEGIVVEPSGPRLAALDGVPIEAPLTGTLIVMANEDRPGVIGGVGTTLGKHGVNIASFALGRNESGAAGVISVDATSGLDEAVREMRGLAPVREAVVVRL
jgi:D-3-phosphoglycerate dehydrogenase / 2-oxoglutarate reductase